MGQARLMALFGISIWLATPVAGGEASFDCAKAGNSAEEAVCGSEGLAGLDRELARLYRLALDGPHMTPERNDELKTMQRGWIKRRNDCWKAEEAETCLADSYAIRIHELRQGYADARSADAAGISLGPFAFHCDGLDALISAVFVNGAAPVVSLTWRETWLVLPIAPSGSGARYARTDAEGTTEFWNKGREATLALPGKDALACREEPTG